MGSAGRGMNHFYLGHLVPRIGRSHAHAIGSSTTATPSLDISPPATALARHIACTNNPEARDWLTALDSYEFVLGRPMRP